jgi:hypothetical protein
MYFDVLGDSRFLIVYHRVPECLERLVPPLVKKCVESIPYKAVRKDFECYRHVNKVDFSKQLYSYVYDEQAGKRLFSSTIRALSNHKEAFLKSWTAGNVKVICRKSPVQVQKASAMSALLCMIAERGEITTSELLRKVRSEGIFDEGDLVTILLSLAEGETIEFRRGPARWT